MNDFVLKYEGYKKKEDRMYRQSWEQTRALAFANAKGQGLKKGVNIFKYWSFPWDPQKSTQSNLSGLTGEDRKQAFENLKNKYASILNISKN